MHLLHCRFLPLCFMHCVNKFARLILAVEMVVRVIKVRVRCWWRQAEAQEQVMLIVVFIRACVRTLSHTRVLCVVR